jgi:hypothetical protein
MTPRPLAYAFGNARVRAIRSRLRGPLDLPALQSAESVAALAEAAGLEGITNVAELSRRLFASLVEDYRRLVGAYPAGRPLLFALLGLHEIENLKLAWRARSRDAPAQTWIRLWRPLGRLERLPLAPWREAPSLREAALACARTLYGPLLRDLLAAGADPAAAEMAMDRWAGKRVAEAAAKLPWPERAARNLALAVVRERDADLIERAGAWGLSSENAAAASVLERTKDLRDPTERRRMRRRLALRAFVGPPFRLAPAVALLLLREEEARAIVAIAGSIASPSSPALLRVLAGSAMGA